MCVCVYIYIYIYTYLLTGLAPVYAQGKAEDCTVGIGYDIM